MSLPGKARDAAASAVALSARRALVLAVLVSGGFLAGPFSAGPEPAAAQESGEEDVQGAGAADGASGEGSASRPPDGWRTRRRLAAVRAPGPPPRVDGRMDEAAWAGAALATDFVQLDPAPGAAPSQRTEVRLLYTADAVYIGARMRDARPDSIVARLSRRDERAVADRFTVAFDSYHDRRTAFAFAVTAAGVQSDQLLHDDTGEDRNWDAVWSSGVSVDSLGWVAELRIPVSQLRFDAPDDAGGDTWGVNFEREIARLEETDQWAPYPEDRSRAVSAFGTLTGLRGLETPNHLEIRPYTVLRADRAPVADGDPFRGPTEADVSFGGDLSYGLGPNLTLNVTVNPDFGQVEADPSVVNLSAFESFFPEKRPFFQEGADIFRFDLGTGPADGQLFYSRRIGRAPHGSVPPDAVHSDGPESTTILGAAKLSGKTSDGWSLGVLGALTAREEARYLAPGAGTSEGEVRSAVTEPLTGYGVARAVRNFRDGESSVGGVFTATVRDVSAGRATGFLPEAALAGGVDARVRFGGGDWQVDGHVLGSRVAGSPEAIRRVQTASARYFQRPDAGHLAYDTTRTSLAGVSANLALQKIGGHWRLGLRGQTRTPGFEVNDLGFQPRADQILGSGYLQYLSLGPGGPFRSWSAYVNGWQGWTWGGERTYSTAAAGGNFQLRNLWSGFVGVELDGAALSPTELRGGPALRQDAELGASGGVGTDPRKPVQLGLHASWGTELGTAGRRVAVGPSVAVQPADAARLTLRPTLSWNRNVSQYVSTVRDAEDVPRYLVGRLEQRTAALTARLDYTFSPDLSLQLWAQPFLSAGDYTEFREVRDPRAEAFDERFDTYAGAEISEEGDRYAVDRNGDGAAELEFANPDFNVRQFRSNIVLRWEYAPGSRIFLVWSQDRSDFAPDGRFDLGRDLDALFGTEPRNVFLVKVQHWLGM